MRVALMDRSIAIGSSFNSGSNSILHVKDKSRTSDSAATTTNMRQCVANIQTTIIDCFSIHLNCVVINEALLLHIVAVKIMN